MHLRAFLFHCSLVNLIGYYLLGNQDTAVENFFPVTLFQPSVTILVLRKTKNPNKQHKSEGPLILAMLQLVVP